MPQQRSAGQGWSCRGRASTAGGTARGGAAPTALTDAVQGAQGWEINLLSQGGWESVCTPQAWLGPVRFHSHLIHMHGAIRPHCHPVPVRAMQWG